MLSRSDIDRLVRAILAEEMDRLSGCNTSANQVASWDLSMSIDEDGLGFDSLSRLAAAARLNQFFQLHQSGVEDYLLVQRRLGDWIELTTHHFDRFAAAGNASITFQTSGSTGQPKHVEHTIADLFEEVVAFSKVLGPIQQVCALVPPHHIYGFLFTVLMPSHLGVEVVDRRGAAPGSTLGHCTQGDLVVATPYTWGFELASGATVDVSVQGLTSSSPAPRELWLDAHRAQLKRLIEIYGSSETAGIGWREDGASPFQLLPHLNLTNSRQIVRTSGILLDPPDRLDWEHDQEGFRPAGRLDAQVQVGGVNVSPMAVAAELETVDGVAEVAVRLDRGIGRLKAFVVASPEAPVNLRQHLNRHALHNLPAPARPTRIDFGPRLPRTALGKLCDWS